ncbi:cell-cell cohesion protein MtsF [Stigmatella sp. ncwal1]|uniref:Cell-cell cohesion protein MtsF n=1 Tax=Stigmatella ashevillensis TaxID=2995309 RepID=A0ABT5DN58_9BACT|nr:cell-cell cohesion protein MtsF [Stigmatella ashevillena]MDC0713806.1 cell-cell cohesion protein MtsF [Stigmatella ashevillena]
MTRLLWLLPLVLLSLTACSSGGENTPDAGDPALADECNSPEDALNKPQCELSVEGEGQVLEAYLSTAGDEDWYSVRIPATAGPRTLVQVTAGYAVQSTAVNLSVNLLREDGAASLIKGVDKHGQGAPRPVEFIVPFGEPNARLLILLKDEPNVVNRPNFDARSPYFVRVKVLENPDLFEPNDTPAQATPLTFVPEAGKETGRAVGYLGTKGDVDYFSFTAPAKKVLYVRVSAPELTPPPAYRLSYELVRPNGTAEAQDQVPNTSIAAELATARRVKDAGQWLVKVKGYQAVTDPNTPPGDVRQAYTVEVQLMDEADAQDINGDNDLRERATVKAFGPYSGSAQTLSFAGRLGSVPDVDWYAVDVPAYVKSGVPQPSLLHYRFTPGSGGGRFTPLPGFLDRQLLVFTQVTKGTTLADQRVACATDVTVCPKGYAEKAEGQGLVEAYCGAGTAALCVHSSRQEDPQRFATLRNFEGAIPVPPGTQTVRYFFLVEDASNDWADDRDYTLSVTWVEDADESDRYAGGNQEQPTALTLANDPTGNTFPAPPASATVMSGVLSHGYGRLQPGDRLTGRGARGPGDYDAVPTDVDSYILTIPGGQAQPQDRTWELQWTVQNLADGGIPPHGLALDLTFCDGDRLDGGACTPVSRGSRNSPLTLAYRGDALRAWHSPSGSTSGLQPLYSKTVSGNATVFTVLPYACSCLEPRFVRGGTLRVDVSATERETYDRLNYSVRTAYTDYPKSYAVDGGTSLCPAPQQDGGTPLPDGGTTPITWTRGCQFTLQP